MRAATRSLAALALALLLTTASACTPRAAAPAGRSPTDVAALAGVARSAIEAFDEGNAALAKTPPDYVTARGRFQLAVEKDGNFTEAYLNLAATHAPALQHVQEVLARDHRNLEALNNLGLIYLDQGKLALAQMIFSRGLDIDKRSAQLHNNFALVALKRGEIGLAAAHFNRAVESEPQNFAARLNLGAIFLDNLDFDGAIKHFQLALAERPRSLEAQLGLGAAHYGARRWKEAASAFEAVLENSKDHPQALLALGRVYHERLNDSPRALGYYRRYLARGNVAADDPAHLAIREIEAGKKAPKPEPKSAPKKPAPAAKPAAAVKVDVKVDAKTPAKPTK
jgi:tetratricopeptide (TPR) repeat protein